MSSHWLLFLEISHQNIDSKDLGLSISKFFNSLWAPMADEFQFLSPEAGLKTEIKTNSASWAWAVGRWGDQRGMCSLEFSCIRSNPFFFRWLWRFPIDSGNLFVTHPAKHQVTLSLDGIGETDAHGAIILSPTFLKIRRVDLWSYLGIFSWLPRNISMQIWVQSLLLSRRVSLC